MNFKCTDFFTCQTEMWITSHNPLWRSLVYRRIMIAVFLWSSQKPLKNFLLWITSDNYWLITPTLIFAMIFLKSFNYVSLFWSFILHVYKTLKSTLCINILSIYWFFLSDKIDQLWPVLTDYTQVQELETHLVYISFRHNT